MRCRCEWLPRSYTPQVTSDCIVIHHSMRSIYAGRPSRVFFLFTASYFTSCIIEQNPSNRTEYRSMSKPYRLHVVRGSAPIRIVHWLAVFASGIQTMVFNLLPMPEPRGPHRYGRVYWRARVQYSYPLTGINLKCWIKNKHDLNSIIF